MIDEEYSSKILKKRITNQIFEIADSLRDTIYFMDSKQIILSLLFYKYVSDVLDKIELRKSESVENEIKNELWIPRKLRWSNIYKKENLQVIGQSLDKIMDILQSNNPELKDCLPGSFSRLSKQKIELRNLFDLLEKINFSLEKELSMENLAYIFDYLLDRFARMEGKIGGDYFTPKSINLLMVEILKPRKGKIFDPCCGIGNTLAEAANHYKQFTKKEDSIKFYGQELIRRSWQICKLNLFIRGIDINIGLGDSFLNNQFKDARFDYIFANPPINVKNWGSDLLNNDKRWRYGSPPSRNANYAWIQHILYHLSNLGSACVVLSQNTLFTNNIREFNIRKKIIEENLVQSIISLPAGLFYNTSISSCIWIFSKNASNCDELLLIDARDLGTKIDSSHMSLTNEEIIKISRTFHDWQNGKEKYADIPGFAKSVKLSQIRRENYNLFPGKYVGVKMDDLGEINFEELKKLTADLSKILKKSDKLENELKQVLSELGYEI